MLLKLASNLVVVVVMKKQTCKIKNTSVLSSYLILFFCLTSFLLNSCCLSEKYDHQKYFFEQDDVLFEDNNGNLYFEAIVKGNRFCNYSLIEEKGYRYIDNNFFDEDNQNFSYGFSVSNNDYLFVYGSCGITKSKSAVKIYDKYFDQKKTLLFDESQYVKDMVCSDNYLYFCFENEGAFSLHRYDYLNDSFTLLKNNLVEGSNYQDEDISLFFKNHGGLRHKSFVGKYTDKTRLLQFYGHFFTEKIDLSMDDKYINIVVEGENHQFEKDNIFNDFYYKVYLIDNQLIFATYEYKSSVLHYNDNFECVCGLKESYLYKYDILTNELLQIKAFKSGTFLIDYDLENCQYYFDGGLYINDSLHRECKKVTTEQLKEGEDPGIYNINFLSYYKGEFYGI